MLKEVVGKPRAKTLFNEMRNPPSSKTVGLKAKEKYHANLYTGISMRNLTDHIVLHSHIRITAGYVRQVA